MPISHFNLFKRGEEIMNDQMQMPPSVDQPKKNNTTMIIAVVAVVVICCCCVAVVALWQYGDQILKALGQ
jgi:uncharacterized membrane protein YidH (DUF202 family)